MVFERDPEFLTRLSMSVGFWILNRTFCDVEDQDEDFGFDLCSTKTK